MNNLMNNKEILSEPELRRYAGQISLPQMGRAGQEKLKRAKVAVVGAGGLGSVVLQYLASIGIGQIGIIDYSLVDERNIQRQVLYGGNDLGKLKTIISKQQLENVFPFIDFEIINIQLTPSNAERILSPFSLVVDATNDQNTRKLLSNVCEKLKLPLVFGLIKEYTGVVGVVNSTSDNFRDTLVLENVEGEVYTKANISLVYGFIGNLMAFEVFKVLTDNDCALVNQCLLIDLRTYQIVIK